MSVYFVLFEIRKAGTDTKSALASRWHLYSSHAMSSSMRTIGEIAEAEIGKLLIRISVF